MTDDPELDLPTRRWTRPLVLVMPLAIAGAIAFFAYTRCRARSSLDDTPGLPAGALVVAGDRPVLVVVDIVTSGRPVYRLLALDPATGNRLGERVIDEAIRCWPASAGRMWCLNLEGHTHLIAVPSFDAVPANDNDTASGTWRGRPDDGCAFADSIPRGVDHLTFGSGTQRRPLVRHAAHEDGKEPVSYSLPGTADFLAPSFLHTEDASLVLVQHDAALERPGVVQLTRVDDELHAMWTAELPGRCETAHVVSDKLVITTSDPAARAYAFELATGKLAWRFTFSK